MGDESKSNQNKSYCLQELGSHAQIREILLQKEKVKTVTYHRYLGLIFPWRNLSSKALSTLAAHMEKAVSTVTRMI